MKKETVKIKKATMDDSDELFKLKLEAKKHERQLNKELKPIHEVKSHYREYLEKDIDNEHRAVFIAIIDNEIVGMIIGRIYRSLRVVGYERRATMGNLYVKEKCRRKGVAKKLINGLTKWCKSKKAKTITLSVYSENKVVQEIYKRAGFKETFVTMHKKI